MPQSNEPTPDVQDAQRWQEEDASKPNSNCLAGMQCPQCGSYEPFNIEVLTVVQMWDEGTESDFGGGIDWKDESYCECYACQYTGTVKDFSKEIHP